VVFYGKNCPYLAPQPSWIASSLFSVVVIGVVVSWCLGVLVLGSWLLAVNLKTCQLENLQTRIYILAV
jgi:hypothetical protein